MNLQIAEEKLCSFACFRPRAVRRSSLKIWYFGTKGPSVLLPPPNAQKRRALGTSVLTSKRKRLFAYGTQDDELQVQSEFGGHILVLII